MQKIFSLITLTALFVAVPNRAYCDLLVEFDDVTGVAGGNYQMNVYISGDSVGDLLAEYSARFSITNLPGATGTLAFDTIQSNSEVSDSNYVFFNKSGAFVALPIGGDIAQQDETSTVETNLNGNKRLLATLDLNHDRTDGGGTYEVRVDTGSLFTYFRESGGSNLTIDPSSSANFGTITLTAVPEPTSLLILSGAAIASLTRRRRRLPQTGKR